jgi:hypothetical protein
MRVIIRFDDGDRYPQRFDARRKKNSMLRK